MLVDPFPSSSVFVILTVPFFLVDFHIENLEHDLAILRLSYINYDYYYLCFISDGKGEL